MQTVSYVFFEKLQQRKNEAMKTLAGVDFDDNHVCSRFSSQNVLMVFLIQLTKSILKTE